VGRESVIRAAFERFNARLKELGEIIDKKEHRF
jgi:hypothetical protein